MISSLYWYFHKGGLEINLETGGFNISIKAIQRRIRERIIRHKEGEA